MSDSAAIPDGAAGAGELRIAVNQQISRGMLLTIGTTAQAMDRLGVLRSVIWSFAELQGRNTCRALGVQSRPTERSSSLKAAPALPP